MWYIRKIILVYPEKFFELTPPPKFLDALFLSKSAPQSLAPQLLEASYAPGGRTFFSLNLPTPPPSKGKWSAPYHVINTFYMNMDKSSK